MQIFFPKSAQSLQWTVFNAGSPRFWCGSHHGHFFYMSSRIVAGVPKLKDVEAIMKRLEQVKLGESGEFGQREHLRLRGIYFDSKNENYHVFVDYLVPVKHAQFGNTIIQQSQTAEGILNALEDGQGLYSDGEAMWYCTFWDILRIQCFQLSERFDPDSDTYYSPFMANFETGSFREGAASSYSRASSWVDP